MPYGDGTGPASFGPMTDRSAGFCAGFARPGFANRPYRSAFFPGGRGYRNWFYATGMTGAQRAAAGLPAWGCRIFPHQAVEPYPETSKEEQVKALKMQQENLKAALDQINKQIEEMEENSSN